MRLSLLIIAGLCAVSGFAPSMCKTTTTTQLDLQRREPLVDIFGLVAAPAIANAKGSTWFYDQKIETVQEDAQMHTGGRVDLNLTPPCTGTIEVMAFVAWLSSIGRCTDTYSYR